MRLFIAVDIPGEVKDAIETAKQEFKGIKGLRFVNKENIHLTMKFLAEVREERATGIQEALKTVKFSPFKLSLCRLGAFPNEKNIRVLWVGAEPEKPLLALKDEIDRALPSFKDDHLFKAHITIARAGFLSQDARKRIADLLLNKRVEKKEFLVDRFVLYKSKLTAKGPIYEVISKFQ